MIVTAVFELSLLRAYNMDPDVLTIMLLRIFEDKTCKTIVIATLDYCPNFCKFDS